MQAAGMEAIAQGTQPGLQDGRVQINKLAPHNSFECGFSASSASGGRAAFKA